MAPPTLGRCRTHPASLAGWTCEECGSSLCPLCVAEQRYGATPVETCSRCGGRAMALRRHRSERSYASRLVDALRFMVRPSTWISLVALGLFCALMAWVGGFLGWMIAAGATWAYLFYVFLCAARGVELDVPDFSSPADLVNPLLRGLVSTLFLWAPGVLYLGLVKAWTPEDPFASMVTDPIFLLIIGWSLFYGPIAFMVAATDTPVLTLLNPVALVSWAFKLGADYLIALGVLGVSLIVDQALEAVGGVLAGTGIPILSSVIPQVLSLTLSFFMAHVLGLLLYVRGDKVGYGLEDDYYEPALPGVRPQGQLPMQAQGQPAPRAGELAAPRAVEPALPARAASASAPELADSLRAVAEAITARDVAGTVSAYRGLASSSLSGLTPEQHLFVGRAAASGGDFPLAAKAFETAADVAPQAPTAPQALVLLARLCAERMQDPERAQSVYRYILHRYPGTDASRFAAQRVPPEA